MWGHTHKYMDWSTQETPRTLQSLEQPTRQMYLKLSFLLFSSLTTSASLDCVIDCNFFFPHLNCMSSLCRRLLARVGNSMGWSSPGSIVPSLLELLKQPNLYLGKAPVFSLAGFSSNASAEVTVFHLLSRGSFMFMLRLISNSSKRIFLESFFPV